jgi:cytochrome c-type biogenesis protein CcmE
VANEPALRTLWVILLGVVAVTGVVVLLLMTADIAIGYFDRWHRLWTEWRKKRGD